MSAVRSTEDSSEHSCPSNLFCGTILPYNTNGQSANLDGLGKEDRFFRLLRLNICYDSAYFDLFQYFIRMYSSYPDDGSAKKY